jgi:hypothetical protein
MVAVEIGLPALVAWKQAAEERGAKVPIPDQVRVIWVPCAESADWHPDVVEVAA